MGTPGTWQPEVRPRAAGPAECRPPSVGCAMAPPRRRWAWGEGSPGLGGEAPFACHPGWGGKSFKKESSASWKLGSVSESSACQERPRGHRDAAVTARLWDPWGNHLAPVVGSRWGSSQTGSKLRFTREYLCT